MSYSLALIFVLDVSGSVEDDSCVLAKDTHEEGVY